MIKAFSTRFKNLMRFRWLLGQLVSRDLKVKYKRSYLGLLWSLLNPLLMMMVMSIVFSKIFRYNIEYFPVYLLCGQVLFTFFSDATVSAMNSIIQGSGLIKKVYIPKYIFPLARVLSCLVNMMFSLAAVLIVILFSGMKFSFTMLLFPVPIFYLFMFSLGVGLVLSVVATYFRDMLYLYTVALQALMYFTPLFYPIEAVPENVQAFIIRLNPMYHYISYFRDIIMYNTVPSLKENMICLFLGIVALIIGLLIFKRFQKNFLLHI